MTDFILDLKERATVGKGESQRGRREGFVPTILYSNGQRGIPAFVEERQFRQLAERALPSQVFTFKSEVKELDGKIGIVKDLQLVPDNREILHIDFQLLQEGQPVVVSVPLSIQGEAPGVKNQGGVLTVQCKEIKLSCLPSSIPTEFEVSVSGLQLGQRIRTGDLELPEGVTLKSNPEETIANVIAGRAARLMNEGPESGGEAGAPAQGAAA
ncbi:MAG: 50S ribosomal protein L25 [Bdellovibrionales bacterium]|nr:50S ribosomal protein L25 [Bdellovibrionales bacterium]